MMKKALAQNPNLLRTLLGLSFTLIFLLSYAVYGATIAPSYYIYETEATTTEMQGVEPQHWYNEENNTTTWSWEFALNGQNLTWVNLTAMDLSHGAIVKLSSGAYLFSHHLLGISNARDFSCQEQCQKNITHQVISESGEDVSIIALTEVDPARRNNGSVYGEDIGIAEDKARAEIEYLHSPSIIRVEIIEQGNRSTYPSIELTSVNEEFDSIAVFSVDAATEFVWALASVVGCFAVILVPSFTIFFAARAKEKRDNLKLIQQQEDDEKSINEN
jgi:hypothetical protein